MSYNPKAVIASALFTFAAITSAFAQNKDAFKLASELLPGKGVDYEFLMDDNDNNSVMIAYIDQDPIIGIRYESLGILAKDGLISGKPDGIITKEEIIFLDYNLFDADNNQQVSLYAQKLSGINFYVQEKVLILSSGKESKLEPLRTQLTKLPQIMRFIPDFK